MSPFNTLTMATTPLYNDTKLKIKASKLDPKKTYIIEVTDITSGRTTTINQRAKAGNLKRVINFETTGVTKTVIRTKEGQLIREMFSVSTSQIDCCIAKLVHDAINCTCKCSKCDEDLKRAHKIHLLLQSARYEAHTVNAPERANDKILKARELCVEVCACGC